MSSFLILLLQTSRQFYKFPHALAANFLFASGKKSPFLLSATKESSMKICPKGAQGSEYNKAKSANCFATT